MFVIFLIFIAKVLQIYPFLYLKTCDVYFLHKYTPSQIQSLLSSWIRRVTGRCTDLYQKNRLDVAVSSRILRLRAVLPHEDVDMYCRAATRLTFAILLGVVFDHGVRLWRHYHLLSSSCWYNCEWRILCRIFKKIMASHNSKIASKKIAKVSLVASRQYMPTSSWGSTACNRGKQLRNFAHIHSTLLIWINSELEWSNLAVTQRI